MSSIDRDRQNYMKMKRILEEALAKDLALAEQFHVVGKFPLLPQKIEDALREVNKRLEVLEKFHLKEMEGASKKIKDDETLVYVYLFNGQGKSLTTWSQLLTEDAMSQYSVNRPIYMEEKYADNLLHARKHDVTHAALVVIVKKADVLEAKSGAFGMDALDQPLVRVREGALKLSNIVCLMHDEKRYERNQHGRLVQIVD